MPSIDVSDVSFSYRTLLRKKQVFDGFCLNIDGGVCCLLGHNGAGKTTLLKLIYGVLKPSQGAIAVHMTRMDGMALVTGPWGVEERLSSRENLRFREKYLGNSDVVAQGERWARRMGIASYMDTPCRELSSGLFVRAALVLALSESPEVLLLDEPTAAVAPETRVVVAQAAAEMADVGSAVVVATHDFDLAHKVGGRAVVLDEGSLVDGFPLAECSRDELESRYFATVRHVGEGS